MRPVMTFWPYVFFLFVVRAFCFYFILFSLNEQRREGGGGGGCAARLSPFFSFPCSADPTTEIGHRKVVIRVGNKYAKCEETT